MILSNLPNVGRLETAGVIFALLPGLVTYLVQHAICTREREIKATEVVVWALGYTLIAHAIWELLKLPGSYVPTPDIVGICLTAVGLGVVISKLQASGIASGIAAALGFRATSDFPSIWLTTLRRFLQTSGKSESSVVGEFGVFELSCGRRAYGGIVAYSERPKEGHIVLDKYCWLREDGSLGDATNGWLIIRIEDVIVVELVPSEMQADSSA